MRTPHVYGSLALGTLALAVWSCTAPQVTGPAIPGGAEPAPNPHAGQMGGELPPAEAEEGADRNLLAYWPSPTRGETAFKTPLSVLFPTQFQTNGRSCASCHQPDKSFTLAPGNSRRQFVANQTDPLFTAAMADAGPDDTQTEILDKLVNKGLIRVNLPNPNYDPALGSDPYNPQVIRLWRSIPTAINSGQGPKFYFRDPKSGALKTHSTMWDMRESSLESQSKAASQGHAQVVGTFPSTLQQDIASFERRILTTPRAIDSIYLRPPARDPNPIHMDPKSPTFGTPVFTRATFKQEFLKTANIPVGSAAERGMFAFIGTPQKPRCIVCHNFPETLGGGTQVIANAGVSEQNEQGLPLVKMRLKDFDAMGRVIWRNVETSDPGVAVTTGLYKDLNKFKVSQLRGIGRSGRYFHDNNAMAAQDAVDFYRDAIPALFDNLTSDERKNIAAFLLAL